MTIWSPDLTNMAGPRYRALVEALAQEVAEGHLPPGTRLPPQRDLAYRLGVTVGTVSRAYALAAERGLVTGEVGRGTFVRGPTEATGRINPISDGAEDLIKLTVNAPPDPDYGPVIAERLAALAARPEATADLWGYSPKVGFPEHRAAAARWLARSGLATSPERTIITGGAHQALVVAFTALARPGDVVLLEALTYAGVCHAVERLGLRAHGLELDDEGVVPEALDVACRETGARVLFINPSAHNPTTATMSPARRQAIATLARRHQLVVIEDDVYGWLIEDCPPPVASLAPERTLYVGTAAKSVAPALRFGMIHCPESLFRQVADAQHDLFLTCPPLLAELFTQLLADGTADRLAARQRTEAAVRQGIAREILGERPYRAQPTSFHLWLPLRPPWRTSDFTTTVRERGVAVDPGTAFAIDPDQAPHAVRVSLSAAASHARLRQALTVLVTTLDETPARRRDVI